ncbi:MAG: hypothetical protein EBT80_05375 [Chitinophagales bacterium]|nr:hypothetical protein [Chitinophagales bacterium]
MRKSGLFIKGFTGGLVKMSLFYPRLFLFRLFWVKKVICPIKYPIHPIAQVVPHANKLHKDKTHGTPGQ